MSKNSDDKKIKGVGSTSKAKGVESTEAVGEVGGVKATSAVSGVRRAGAVDGTRLTRNMTLAEREELFRMIDQEADKLFSASGLTPAKRKVVESAVKMAIDAGLLPDAAGSDGLSDSVKGKKR